MTNNGCLQSGSIRERNKTMKRFELYLHIPFCKKKCAYCDFLSAPAEYRDRLAYVKRLKEEMAFYREACAEYEADTVFIGGGTPTVLEGRHIAEIMEALRENFHISPRAEITIECNPGTLDQNKAAEIRGSGINRISLGLQSASNLELAMLGRIHTFEDFLDSFGEARKAGFQNINVDLMSALPGQTVKTWEQTLKKVTALHPEHISAYSLMIEEGTPFYAIYHEDDQLRAKGEKPRLLPPEEEERAIYDLTEEFLAGKGYQRYEISNYAKPGFHCRHNVGYWTRKNYLGLGLGAASLMENVRFSNTSVMKEYMEIPFEHREIQKLDRNAQMEEFMFLGLRLTEGISRSDFQKEFGTAIDLVYGEVLRNLRLQGLAEAGEGRIFLTRRGIDVSNYVLSQFLLDTESQENC